MLWPAASALSPNRSGLAARSTAGGLGDLRERAVDRYDFSEERVESVEVESLVYSV